jgi:hypothetical protein
MPSAYQTGLEAMARSLEQLAARIRNARSASDLSAARAHVTFIDAALRDNAALWREDLIRYAADDTRERCGFHGARRKPEGCSMCRKAVAA